MRTCGAKSLVPLILLFCLLPSAQAADQPAFRVATFQSDVTPPVGGHPLIWVTPVKEVEDPLLAKGIVLDDGKKRIVLCTVDWCGLCNSSHRLFCEKIARAAQTPVANVAVHSVHQHTAPYTDGDAQRLLEPFEGLPLYVDFAYLDEVTDRLAAAVAESLGRFQPFDSVGTGTAKVDRVASSRRIRMPDGSMRWRMSSATDPAVRALPEGRIDPNLLTVTLARDGAPLVRMHYYATHPQSFYGDPRACSDVAGFARRRLEEKEGVFQIYFTGCSGDVAMGKYNDRSVRARTELADRLYAGMAAAAAQTSYRPVSQIKWRTQPLRLPLRTDAGYTVEENRARMCDPAATAIIRIRAATRVAFAERIDEPITLSLLQFDEVSILNLPGECMVEFQLFAKKLRPDRFVAVAAYGDLGPGYICTKESFSEGGYEPSASRAGREAEGVLKEAIRRLFDAN